MLIVSFIVGYIVSEVVRKCGCDIVEGATSGGYGGDDIDDPGNSPLPEEIGYDDPACNFGVNTPIQACNELGGWIEYNPPGGIKKGSCKWVCPGSDLGVCDTDPNNPKSPAKCNYKPQPN